MLDVIICDDNEVSIKKNQKIINKVFVNSDIEYQIYSFKEYDRKFIELVNSTSTRKVFIINLDMDNNGIRVASKIREISFDSVIILMAKCNKYYEEVFNNRIIPFDYICKSEEYEYRLTKDMNEIIKIISMDNTFKFKYKAIIYRIPFKNINYIEKEANIKRCIIHTANEDYYIVSSIDRLLTNLNSNFVKIHQSCIVNINNIKMLDCTSNKVIFDNNIYTSLLTEKAKKKIKEILLIK